MTEQHRAKPEVWAAVEKWSKNDLDKMNCFLELRDRVEALELWRATTDNTAPVTRDRAEDALVERVADAIYRNGTGDGFREEARAAIHAAADWLDQQGLHDAATRLWMEVG